MKKLLTIVLSLVMVMSMTAVSFAYVQPTTDAEGNVTYIDESTIVVSKTYKATNTGTISPAETFNFTKLTCTDVTDAASGVNTTNAPVPTIGSVTYAAGEAGGENATKNITITLPEYTSVGVYTYTFSEVDGGTAGVDYHKETIKLVVTVIEQDGKVRVAAVHTEKDGEAKSGAFDNVYSAGSLAVSKKVTGLLGDQSKEFTVKVIFTAPEGDTVREAITYTDGTAKSIEAGWTGTKEVEIVLTHDETVTFANIPYGVTYTVEENDYTGDGYDAAKYDGNQNGKIKAAAVSTEITNNKGATIDTGIILDNGLYIVLLAGVAVAAGMFFMKRRQDDYDM